MKYKWHFLLLFLCLFSCLRSNAQVEHEMESLDEHHRAIGLTAALQESQFSILIPLWIAHQATLAPSIDFSSMQGVSSDFGFGLYFKNFLKLKKLSPYYGLRAGLILGVPSTTNSSIEENTIDTIFGLSFGGEYFIDSQFSISIEAQGNLNISDEQSNRFGNPGGNNFNTATMIAANIYF